MLNISSHLTEMFWEYVGSPFWIVIFPCVFSNCYLPTGHRGLLLREKKKAWNWHYILKRGADLQGKTQQPTDSAWKSNTFSLSLTSSSLHFRFNLLINYSQLLKNHPPFIQAKKNKMRVFISAKVPYNDTIVLMVKYSGGMQQFTQINSFQIIHGWSHGVLAPYLQ